MSEYVRTKNGTIVHTTDCYTLFRGGVLVATTTPWFWAEGKSPGRIIEELEELRIRNVRFCRHCIGARRD